MFQSLNCQWTQHATIALNKKVSLKVETERTFSLQYVHAAIPTCSWTCSKCLEHYWGDANATSTLPAKVTATRWTDCYFCLKNNSFKYQTCCGDYRAIRWNSELHMVTRCSHLSLLELRLPFQQVRSQNKTQATKQSIEKASSVSWHNSHFGLGCLNLLFSASPRLQSRFKTDRKKAPHMDHDSFAATDEPVPRFTSILLWDNTVSQPVNTLNWRIGAFMSQSAVNLRNEQQFHGKNPKRTTVHRGPVNCAGAQWCQRGWWNVYGAVWTAASVITSTK